MQHYKVAILGANGQLGSDLISVCKKNGISYLALTREQFDASVDNLEGVFNNLRVDYIINCIATTNVDGCENSSDIAFKLNASFVHKLSQFCQLNGITLIHISTDYVFDGRKTTAYLETDLPTPVNIYGLSKSVGDKLIQLYTEKYFIFRVSSLFGIAGASGKGGNFITTMIKLGNTLENVSVISDQITCPTATLDIARCIIYFMQNTIQDYGIYNCVSSNSCSWYEFTQEIYKHANIPLDKLSKINFADYKFKAKRPQYGVLSVNKLSKYYNMPTWQQSLDEYFKLKSSNLD